MSQHFFYPPNNGSVPGTITVNQGLPNTDANAWPLRITDGTHDATVTAGGALNVAIVSGITNPLPVHDAALDVNLSTRASETSLVALSDKSAGSLVPEAFDYQDITYVAATTRIDQVVYKLGGSGGTTVATLTMGYDGSDRLSSVTKT